MEAKRSSTRPVDDRSTLVDSPSKAMLVRRVLLLLVPAVAMAFVWQITPLKQFIEPDMLASLIADVRDTWWSPVLVTVLSVAGSVLMVPLTLIVLAHGAMFDFPLSWIVAETTMMITSVALYLIGRRAGEGVVDRLVPDEMRTQLDNLGARGVLGLAALRWIPVAHFGLLSMSLGALNVPLSRFVVSTFIGQTPVVTLWVVLGDRVRAGLVDPNLRTLGLLFGVMISIVMVALGMRLLSRRRKTVSA